MISQTVAADIAALLRSRHALLWVVTREEARVESHLIEATSSAGYLARTWDVANGLQTIAGTTLAEGSQDPGEALKAIAEAASTGRIGRSSEAGRGAWIMRDLAPWLTGITGATPCRQLRNLARSLPTVAREKAQAVIVLSTSGELPPELASHAVVIDWPLPDREEIAGILAAAIEPLPDDIKASALPDDSRDAAIDAALGLSGEEAAGCYAKSLVQTKRIDPAAIAQEKKRVIARERVLEWFDPLPGGIDAVGGLVTLKQWLAERRNAYSPEARAYGLPSPKGMLLVGPPGTGKSLTAKAVATAWGIPLLRLDLGALKSKFVGDSEGNLRRALRVAESVGRCVVWIDEIEKALAGAVQGGADGGVSADALGSILSWMQERQGEAFVIATSNDVKALPPELIRKGRFDELWFVDLPNAEERAAILKASLRTFGRDKLAMPFANLAKFMDGFTGSEIAALIPDALFAAFADGAREITDTDIADAAAKVTPLSKTAAEKINALREWAAGKARFANGAPKVEQAIGAARNLDF